MRCDPWGDYLPGSAPKQMGKRTCDKCGEHQETQGGVQVSPARWHCAACWRRRVFSSHSKAVA